MSHDQLHRSRTCLDENEVQRYLALPDGDEARARIEEHLDGCDACRALVAGAAQVAAAPDRISRYVIGERIGAGAMGIVHAAFDPELRRRVAIKLLVQRADARLLREAQALARVSHPNVIPIYDVGTHEGGVFLAMELVDGESLTAWLASRARSPAEIVGVLTAAGRGLAAAHAAGLVHRDFKPDNLLVGRDGRVRVTDFGLARDRGEPDSAPAAESSDFLAGELTRPGTLVGTPVYMAPELLAGGVAEARSDQFSFCVTAYEALYGHRPFAARTIGELRRAVVERQVRDEPRGAGVPGSLRRLILRGLSPRPEDRFASMDDLLTALARRRPRVPRRLLAAALVTLVAGGVLAGDAVLRASSEHAARASFTVVGEQLERAMASRYESFGALAQVTAALPVIREVAGNFDKAEFGLGDAGGDARRLELLHENLASADWSMWTRAGGSWIAVGDYKGRLVYSSGAPRTFGTDLRRVDAVARAYDGQETTATLLARRDAGGLVDATSDEVLFVLSRSAVPGTVARAVLVQAINARQIVDDLTIAEDARVDLIPGGGVARPPEPGWLVASHVLSAPDGERIGVAVLSHRVDRGLDGRVRWLIAALAGSFVIFQALLASAAKIRKAGASR